jgi:ATP-dependent DNA helicase RecG
VRDDVLQLPLQFLKGVGPRKAADLKKAGLLTVEDLLFRFPIRYEDRSRLQPIVSIKPGQTAWICPLASWTSAVKRRNPARRVVCRLAESTSPLTATVCPGLIDTIGCRRLRSS